ncbi:C6 transcription factor, putative [Talaromyces stipitatus ATCC 10500]|uniref:C6 transcription factor, putative n=1 Tax=Talaromyces stipitatus (strain ATCC 10500 / CBS 375.48 / QM 6759 / NRRL 1006) TaxID=441959 RepID=B8MG66_TALSN|nr:C6 transcription factor, putative [Talaromyces stipitatus ATCC 10500]EED15933.1 C6 transcription factor, putative [Talaromyces stipitatus ATCC 10500]
MLSLPGDRPDVLLRSECEKTWFTRGLWALAICNIEGFEDTMLTLLGATDRSRGRRERLMQLWTDESSSESLHEAWKTSRLWGALEKMLSPTDTDTQSPAKRPREEDDDGLYLSASSQWGFRVNRGQNLTAPVAGPKVVDPSSSPAMKRQRLSSTTDTSSPVTPGRLNATQNLPLPSHTSALVETYFSQTHPWFPIIPKHNMLRASYMYANGATYSGNPPKSSGDHAALWAILSYTTGQEQSGSNAHDAFMHDPLAQSKEYYHIARGLIPSEKERFDLGHVQALLLLTLVNVGSEDWTAAWLLSGQAARMAEAMELSKPLDSRRTDETRQRRAVYMGCFVIDSILSVRLSRSPCLRSNDSDVVGRLDEDGLEEWNSWVDVLPSRAAFESRNAPQRGPLLALSCFNRLFELTTVLNKIAWDFPQATNAQAFIQKILLDLKSLDDRLPANCRLISLESDEAQNRPPLLLHQTYFHLTYTATLLFLYTRQLSQSHFMQGVNYTAVDGIEKILYRTLDVLSQHVENFQACAIPPLLEFPLRSIFESVSSVRSKLESSGFPVSKWITIFSQRLTEVSSPWPVFRTLSETLGSLLLQPTDSYPLAQSSVDIGTSRSYDSQVSEPRANQAIPDSGHGRASITQNSGFSPNLPKPFSLQPESMYRAAPDSSTSGLRIPSGMDPSNQEQTAAHILDKLMGGRNPSSNTDPNNMGQLLNQQQQTQTGSTPDSAILSQHNLASAGFNIGQQQRSRSYMTDEASSSPNDLDSIFKDLAYIDTTDWANSRQEGLREFGFMDDNTFQAFCHDPDRLVGSRPLVLPTAMSIADIWPPPGFFPETFQAGQKNDRS